MPVKDTTSFRTAVSSLEVVGKKSVNRKLRKQGVREEILKIRHNYISWANINNRDVQ